MTNCHPRYNCFLCNVDQCSECISAVQCHLCLQSVSRARWTSDHRRPCSDLHRDDLSAMPRHPAGTKCPKCGDLLRLWSRPTETTEPFYCCLLYTSDAADE